MSCGLLFMGGGEMELVCWLVRGRSQQNGEFLWRLFILQVQSFHPELYWRTKVCLSGRLIYREMCGRPSQTDLPNQQRFPNKKRGSISAWFPIGRAWHCMTTTLTKTLRCPNTGTMIDNLLSWHLWNQKITKHNMFAICNLGIIDELILTYKQSHIQDRS